VLTQDLLEGTLDGKFRGKIEDSLLQQRMGYQDIASGIMQREVEVVKLDVVLKLFE